MCRPCSVLGRNLYYTDVFNALAWKHPLQHVFWASGSKTLTLVGSQEMLRSCLRRVQSGTGVGMARSVPA